MKLIIGIGNPDPEYQETRHNVGWMFLDWLQKKHKAEKFAPETKLNAHVTDADIDGTKAKLIKPLTYVNKSGETVKKAKTWSKAKNEDIVVIQDDLDIPFGMCKLSFDKNSGGHKGVDSIITALKTKKFYRIRIGIGVKALDKARSTSEGARDAFVHDFVLKKFTPAQHEELRDIFTECEIRLMHILRHP